jgi:hypothetical protein
MRLGKSDREAHDGKVGSLHDFVILSVCVLVKLSGYDTSGALLRIADRSGPSSVWSSGNIFRDRPASTMLLQFGFARLCKYGRSRVIKNFHRAT